MGDTIETEQGDRESHVSSIIREIRKSDYTRIKEIHEKFYKTEFDLPDFVEKYICSFVVVNEDNNDIICAGGLRKIVEAVLITNQDYSARTRKKALFEVLAANTYFAQKYDYHELHAFVQDPQWEHHLRKVGFNDTKGKALVLNL